MPTKSTTIKSAAPKVPRKPRGTAVKKAEVVHHVAHHTEAEAQAAKKSAVIHQADVTAPTSEAPVVHEKHTAAKGRYIFATGRRKTAVSNVRLFEGKGETVVNKIPVEKYFSYSFFMEEINRPFQVTGLAGKYHFTAHVNGGGPHAQATAVRHGIAMALSKISEDIRKVLKKNGFLTRDDRKKERKKPGLKRARRSPQWAKR
jgi:small subunit ribosomal protein S9